MTVERIDKYLVKGEVLLATFSAQISWRGASEPSARVIQFKGTLALTDSRLMAVGVQNIALVGLTEHFLATTRTNIRSLAGFVTPPTGRVKRALFYLYGRDGMEIGIILDDNELLRTDEVRRLLCELTG